VLICLFYILPQESTSVAVCFTEEAAVPAGSMPIHLHPVVGISTS
jgi:hypothetical protein